VSFDSCRPLLPTSGGHDAASNDPRHPHAVHPRRRHHREHRQEPSHDRHPSPGPRSGEDTYDLIDDALFALAERRGAWLGDDLTAITLLASLIDQAERCLPDLVTSARLNGHTWDEIARSLATSPGEARLRFDPESPIADTRWPYDL
jgi:hypothetical protein